MVVLGSLGCGPVKVTVGSMDIDGQVFVNGACKKLIYPVKKTLRPCGTPPKIVIFGVPCHFPDVFLAEQQLFVPV